jgi:hypothetical protein
MAFAGMTGDGFRGNDGVRWSAVAEKGETNRAYGAERNYVVIFAKAGIQTGRNYLVIPAKAGIQTGRTSGFRAQTGFPLSRE